MNTNKNKLSAEIGIVFVLANAIAMLGTTQAHAATLKQLKKLEKEHEELQRELKIEEGTLNMLKREGHPTFGQRFEVSAIRSKLHQLAKIIKKTAMELENRKRAEREGRKQEVGQTGAEAEQKHKKRLNQEYKNLQNKLDTLQGRIFNEILDHPELYQDQAYNADQSLLEKLALTAVDTGRFEGIYEQGATTTSEIKQDIADRLKAAIQEVNRRPEAEVATFIGPLFELQEQLQRDEFDAARAYLDSFLDALKAHFDQKFQQFANLAQFKDNNDEDDVEQVE